MYVLLLCLITHQLVSLCLFYPPAEFYRLSCSSATSTKTARATSYTREQRQMLGGVHMLPTSNDGPWGQGNQPWGSIQAWGDWPITPLARNKERDADFVSPLEICSSYKGEKEWSPGW